MGWSLIDENGLLYIFINGHKAINAKTRNNYGSLVAVKPGGTLDRLKLDFSCGHSTTKLRSNFEETPQITKQHTNNDFISQLVPYGINSPSRRGPKRPHYVLNDEMDFPHPSEESLEIEEEIIQEKCVGVYKVDISQIEFEGIRTIRPILVNEMTKQIRKLGSTDRHVTIIPVVEKDESACNAIGDGVEASQELFSQLSEDKVKMIALGGNHFLQAIVQLMEEENGMYSQLRYVPVRLYKGLSEEEKIKISLQHNCMTHTTPATFQDKVYAARRLWRAVSGQNKKFLSLLNSVLGKVDTKSEVSNSNGHIASVARYGDDEFTLFQDIVESYELQHGLKNVPTKFFHSLQGCETPVRMLWLRKASEVGVGNAMADLNKERKIKKVRQDLSDVLELNIDTAKENYPGIFSQASIESLAAIPPSSYNGAILRMVKQAKSLIDQNDSGIELREENSDENEPSLMPAIDVEIKIKVDGEEIEWESSKKGKHIFAMINKIKNSLKFLEKDNFILKKNVN